MDKQFDKRKILGEKLTPLYSAWNVSLLEWKHYFQVRIHATNSMGEAEDEGWSRGRRQEGVNENWIVVFIGLHWILLKRQMSLLDLWPLCRDSTTEGRRKEEDDSSQMSFPSCNSLTFLWREEKRTEIIEKKRHEQAWNIFLRGRGESV